MSLFSNDFSDDSAALEWIHAVLPERPALLGRTQLVLIDGPSSAGKTRFADLLARRLDSGVVHTDDLLDGWDDQFTHWHRLYAQVLRPLSAGDPGRYRRYDWESGRFAEWVEVKPAPTLIVEGVGAARAQGRALASLTVFVTAPLHVRVARSLERDGVTMQSRLREWRRREELHFAADGTSWCADMVLGSTP